MGIVQTAMALSTISPSLSEQFSVLVNLAVVTNVVPYIISLSALIVIMKTAGVSGPTYTRNVVITLIAMLYSTYAIYASGKDAVLGGMLVLSADLHPLRLPRAALRIRQASCSRAARGGTAAAALAALVPLMLFLMAAPPVWAASTLERVKASGKLTVGYRR
jgi:putrescine:ornithine antiporter